MSLFAMLSSRYILSNFCRRYCSIYRSEKQISNTPHGRYKAVLSQLEAETGCLRLCYVGDFCAPRSKGTSPLSMPLTCRTPHGSNSGLSRRGGSGVKEGSVGVSRRGAWGVKSIWLQVEEAAPSIALL